MVRRRLKANGSSGGISAFGDKRMQVDRGGIQQDRLFIKTAGGILVPVMREGISNVYRYQGRAIIMCRENYDMDSFRSDYCKVRDILMEWPEFVTVNYGNIVNVSKVTEICEDNSLIVDRRYRVVCTDEGMNAVKAKLLLAE